MSVASQLQLKGGEVALLHVPDAVEVDLPDDCVPTGDAEAADAVVVFVHTAAELADRGAPFVEAARRDALAWVAYPKGGKLRTDLNRDRLWEALEDEGVRPVRQVSIDDTWSALRFRPA